MRASINLGRIAGIPIGLHYSWIVIAALLTMSLGSRFLMMHPDWSTTLVATTSVATALLFFLSIVIHELSHAVVALRLGLSVRSITLFALGGVAQIDDEASTARGEFWMAFVGPLTSLALGFLCLLVAWPLGWTLADSSPSVLGTMLGWLGYINIVLAIFNLIPAYPLDGGRIFRAIMWGFTGDRMKATRRATRVGQAFAFILIFFGLLQFFMGAGLGGLWLAFIGWFLLEAAGASYVQATLAEELRGVRVSELMSNECETVDARWSLQEFVNNILLHSSRRCFFVRRGEDVIGLITPNEVQRVERETWPYTPVGSAAKPMESLHSVSPDTPASDALRLMSKMDVHQLPVLSNGRVAGIVTRGHLLQLIDTRTRLDHGTSFPRR